MQSKVLLSYQMTVLSLRWFPFGRAMCHIIRCGRLFAKGDDNDGDDDAGDDDDGDGDGDGDDDDDDGVFSVVQPAAICASSFTLVAICSER